MKGMRAKSAPDSRHGDGDNFGTLRCIAAFSVLLSHSYPLSSYGPVEREPFMVLTGGQTSLGTLAVLAFFVISGYLNCWSFDRTPDWVRFAAARALRILPGLVVCLLLCGLVLGPVFTTLPMSDYFQSSRFFRFIFGNLLMVHGDAGLPGVFSDVPVRDAVNGSLWTIRYECLMYLMLAVLGVGGLLTRRFIAMAVAATAFGTALWQDGVLIHLAAAFFSGAALYLWRDRIRPTRTLAAAAASLLVVAACLGALRLVESWAVALLIIPLATASGLRLPDLGRRGDFSYGIYLYAFPVQQMVVFWLGRDVQWYWVTVLSLPLVIGLAAMSWFFIEKPTLAYKRGAADLGHAIVSRLFPLRENSEPGDQISRPRERPIAPR